MIILAIDSSAKSVSAAVLTDGKLTGECFINNGLTHSRTLLPVIESLLKQSDISVDNVDALAVNTGPGSFTGVRIGVATVKGLAFSGGKPCAAVSTLESMAYNFTDENCIVCCVMDARCNQVYNAFFKSENGIISRITDDDALSIDELKEYIINKIMPLNMTVYLAGDGAEIVYEKIKELPVILPAENRRYQRAYGTALAALYNNTFIEPDKLVPFYLRPSQAERELKSKNKENQL